ncbi:acyltransferase family protein [Chitinophaga rhizophila]|uniref:Acyltransferase n=1 Tax=Chitinophaga rhizophila TaxID=2866212 RepID=A0ABS7GJS7_9BACT|nr:acyltransferase [Chitinophaga rhizophila]MBW8686713.1 acyltransferase [Chitinophaga rhizophila]
MQTQPNYIKSLDGVRAIAILLVMAFHFGIIRFGWMGVQLFFVLSGYLISTILLKEKERPASLFQRLKKFWIRRSLRIFPLYYIYLAVFVVICLITAFPPRYFQDLPYLSTYTFNLTRISNSWHESPVYTHFWSLCVEEQFYLFFPFIIFLLSGPSLRALMIAVLIAGPVFRWSFGNYLMQSGKGDFEVFDVIYWFPFSHLDAFFTGLAIPLLGLKDRIKRPEWLFVSGVALALFAGLANYFAESHGHSLPTSMGYNFGDINSYQHVWYYTVLNCSAASLLLLLVSDQRSFAGNLIKKVLENRILVAIGKVSYGMYILHWVIQTQLIERWVPVSESNKYWLFLVDIPVVYGFAVLSFYVIEQRFIQLKDKFTTGNTPVKASTLSTKN